MEAKHSLSIFSSKWSSFAVYFLFWSVKSRLSPLLFKRKRLNYSELPQTGSAWQLQQMINFADVSEAPLLDFEVPRVWSILATHPVYEKVSHNLLLVFHFNGPRLCCLSQKNRDSFLVWMRQKSSVPQSANTLDSCQKHGYIPNTPSSFMRALMFLDVNQWQQIKWNHFPFERRLLTEFLMQVQQSLPSFSLSSFVWLFWPNFSFATSGKKIHKYLCHCMKNHFHPDQWKIDLF